MAVLEARQSFILRAYQVLAERQRSHQSQCPSRLRLVWLCCINMAGPSAEDIDLDEEAKLIY